MPLQVGDKTFYSVPEIAQKLNVTKVTIRNYLKQGKLQGQKTMGKWFISEEDLIDFFHDSN
jgi:excisionase family DNA binding protein